MRKKLKILIPTIFILLIVFMVYKISAKKIQELKQIEQIQNLPSFSFSNINTGKVFTDKDIEQNKQKLIIYFHPDCEFCQEQATGISKKIDDFNSFQLLFVSPADSVAIKSFSNKYALSGHQNIVFLEDKDLIFSTIFGKSGVPSSFIYNKQGKLVKEFRGEANIDELLKYLKD